MSKLRNIARGCVLDVLGAVSKPAPGVHILNGHMITRGEARACHAEAFRRQLQCLSEQVEFIRFEDAVRMIAAGQRPDHPLVAFSFDDGFTDCADMICPVLEEFGVNAALFINPNFVEANEEYIRHFTEKIVMSPGKQPMRRDAIRRLRDRGHVIGAHTLDHYMINTDDAVELNRQIVGSKEAIELHLGAPCHHFAFPYGRLEHAGRTAIDIACRTFDYVYSQSDYKHYTSFEGRVINRRHFEPFWRVGHVRYFLSCHKK
ncbi:MAG: polysaccharide deacetylase family protein [Candidatus Limisoma sp.]